MEIFPAIDLQNGKCVRLIKGDFSSTTIYESDPLCAVEKFAEAGARWLHVVDLDGAQAGGMKQLKTISSIAKQKTLRLQVGGGIRDSDTIEELFSEGIERVVIGSLSIKNPLLVKNWLLKFGVERIVLAFDVKFDENNNPEVLSQGWQKTSDISLWDILEIYADSGLKTVLCTDVSRDGMMVGTNLELYRLMRNRWPRVDVLASGGVKNSDDLSRLAKLGVAGVIVGKAIYEGRINLTESIKLLSSRERDTNAG